MSRVVMDEDRCKGCGLCTMACPYGLVRIADRFNPKGYCPAEWVDPKAICTGCANCAIMCPDLAITVFRTPRREGTGPSQPTRTRPTAARQEAE
jgi:2-oxoglutarate ferredoxin oxidoreductase subunit delta